MVFRVSVCRINITCRLQYNIGIHLLFIFIEKYSPCLNNRSISKYNKNYLHIHATMLCHPVILVHPTVTSNSSKIRAPVGQVLSARGRQMSCSDFYVIIHVFAPMMAVRATCLAVTYLQSVKYCGDWLQNLCLCWLVTLLGLLWFGWKMKTNVLSDLILGALLL